MTTGTCLGELRQRLGEAGFSSEAPELGTAWAAWSDWAAIGVEGMGGEHEDLLLYECSLWLEGPVEDFEPGFTVTITRQFRHRDADGEFSHFERLALSLEYPPDEALRAITTMRNPRFGTAEELWGSAAGGADAWCARVEATAAFTTVARRRARAVDIGQGDL